MQLDEWMKLSEQERRTRSSHWKLNPPAEKRHPIETEWVALIEEAVSRFQHQYGDSPEILYVSSGGAEDGKNPIILVGTRLKAGACITGLPSEYSTFAVRQDAVGDDIEAFKATWTAVLRRLFGWEPAAIDDFIAGRECVWRNVWFRHDTPCDRIPRAMLARSVLRPRKVLDLQQLNAIGKELVSVFSGHFYLHLEPDFDWEAAEQKIAHIIVKYDHV